MLTQWKGLMRPTLGTAALVIVCAGCTQQSGPGEGSGNSWFDKTPAAMTTSDWTLRRSSSAIDGETVTATREYSFASQNTQFNVEITCQPGKKYTLGDMAAGSLGSSLSMTIKSFVGDISQPAETSAFVSETNFVRQNDYTNPIELSYPVARVKIGDNIYSGPMVNMVLRIGDYSNEAIYTGLLTLGESIPMSVELKNGAGVFELVIDRSSEVEQVLAACGQDAAGIARADEEAKKAEEAERKAAQEKALLNTRDTIVAAIRQSCRQFGDASGDYFGLSNPGYYESRADYEHALQTLPDELRTEINSDCASAAPKELSQFQSEFNSEFEYYQRIGGLCTREQFLTYARTLGSGIEQMGVRRCGEHEASVEALVRGAADSAGETGNIVQQAADDAARHD